jgi:hypothetical protein
MHVKQLLNLIFKNTWVSLNWEDNIKIDLKETGWGGMDWTDLAQARHRWRALVNMVMNLQGSIICWEIPE